MEKQELTTSVLVTVRRKVNEHKRLKFRINVFCFKKNLHVTKNCVKIKLQNNTLISAPVVILWLRKTEWVFHLSNSGKLRNG